MGKDKLIVKGARAHNLKSINLELPRNRLIVITGLSGSGKSSLAFDTIYAEGQRRYVESLSAYARQFLGLMEKPDVDYIEGLSPAISIEQRKAHKNPRSTVGTITEIYDYLRLLFARIGTPYCYKCGREIKSQSVDQIVDAILNYSKGEKIIIYAPIVRGRKGEFKKVFEDISRSGFIRVRVDGNIIRIDNTENILLDKQKKHTIDIIVDRVIVKRENRKRLAESVETASNLTDGLIGIIREDKKEELFSKKLACVYCGISYPEIQPRMFSFNSPYGACPECMGLGLKMEYDPDLIIPDKELSFNDGAILTMNPSSNWARDMFYAFSRKYGVDEYTPIKDYPPEIYRILLYGSDEEMKFEHVNLNGRGRWEYVSKFEGIIKNLERRYRETRSEHIRRWMEGFMKEIPCPVCKGKRLKPEALSIKIAGKSIIDITEMTVDKEMEFFDNLELGEKQRIIAHQIIKEIKTRLNFLKNVGLGYLTLDRKAETLSGGEEQRIRLATQIGSQLVGVLYILDEPTIGLHQRDNARLLDTLFHLRDLGNTLLVVEHDEQTILSADYIVDLGPGAGEHGGYVVAQGTPKEIKSNPNSLTGKYLNRELQIPVPSRRREGNGKFLVLKGVREHNLKNIDVIFPLGKFIAVTGVSGSGKSSLVNDVLYPALSNHLYRSKMNVGSYEGIEGIENIDKVINIDQSPIGRTPRSTPATYTGVFTPIRELFSSLSESKMRGYKPGRFSFNVPGGRCENCQGEGTIRIEMNFLPDIYITCDVCKGKRYNRETLEIKYKGKSIADVLDMTVEEALEFFKAIPQIKRRLNTLMEVGLGYIKLGQPATTLSGGEAQRVKLSSELAKKSTGKTFYILDEPTSGLHFDDVKKLLHVLQRFVDGGNTVLVIEHNLDVVKNADYIIDLGPEGGDNGGMVIATGTPEEIASNPLSYTGFYLKSYLRDITPSMK
ncbi:MAG: excinuclease ABC subunit UvrA [Spirochaetes bacterium]|nr:MAG: excinuclease ABC subunit UvrA [Spirochaetota bacterium]